MMQAPQTQVPPELGALLTLVQGMQQGRVSPSTPDGQPTIAAQVMQAAQPQPQQQPGMQDAAQHAGMAAQQQMARQQMAMQQLPKQVEQLTQRQQAMEQGIARAPGAGAVRMAGGGIVGFSGGGTAQTEGPQEERDRIALIKAIKDTGADLTKLGAAGADIFTLPVRALAGIYNTLARAPRAFGINVPFVPKAFGTESMTPYSDRLQSREGGATGSWDAPEPAGRERGQAGYGAAPQAAAAAPQQPSPPAPQAKPGVGIGASGPAFKMPAPPPQQQGPSAAAAMFDQGLGALNKMQGPATPGQELAAFGQQRDVRRTAMQQAGNDPDQQAKDIAASEARAAERAAHISKLEGELAGRSKNAGLIEFLINAKGNKGEGIGAPMASGAAAAIKGDAGRRGESRTIAELKFAYQDAAAKEQAALRDAKLKTDMGDFEGAKKSMEEARAFANSKLMAESKLRGDRAGEMERSEQVDKQVAQQRYNTDVQALTARYGDDIQLKIARIKEAASSDGIDPKEKAAMARLLAAVNSDVPLKTYAKQSELGLKPDAEAKMIARYNELVQQYAPQMANKAPAGGATKRISYGALPN